MDLSVYDSEELALFIKAIGFMNEALLQNVAENGLPADKDTMIYAGELLQLNLSAITEQLTRRKESNLQTVSEILAEMQKSGEANEAGEAMAISEIQEIADMGDMFQIISTAFDLGYHRGKQSIQ